LRICTEPASYSKTTTIEDLEQELYEQAKAGIQLDHNILNQL